ncbi:MAG: hypothetical protein NT007_05030 [Candidatus Kapabacteria bacterium]|nr:hypothetical protein [Candidatus Kapabacteria bacterium]
MKAVFSPHNNVKCNISSKIFQYFICFFLIYGISSAQPSQEELNKSLNIKSVIIARGYQDSIILRWAVGKPAVWEIATRSGYKIERAILTNVNDSDYSKLKFEEIAGSPFKAWNEQQFISYFQAHTEQDPEAESVYMVGLMAGIADQENDSVPQPFSAFQNGLGSLTEARNNLETKFGFSLVMANKSSTAATALGLRAVDKNIINGTTYVYKMSLVEHSKTYKDKDIYVKVKAEAFKPEKYKEEIYFIDGDKEVVLSWNSVRDFNSYNIDRALSKDGPYSRLTKSPILKSKPVGFESFERTGFKNDSLTNYTKYYYRVYGNTAFADQILVGEIEVMPKDRTPPQKPNLDLPINALGAVYLKWNLTPPIEGDLKGFLVARSNKYTGPFIRINDQLLPTDAREYIDKSFDKDAENYYIIQALDTALNYSISNTSMVTLIDSIPPSKPAFISGKIDSLGIVTIIIEKNKEKDLMGYRLFKANGPEHEFSVIYEGFVDLDSSNQQVQTIFIDTVTLNSLTPYIYYKVQALDFHFNPSEYSEYLKIKRPDTIPPTTPVFTGLLVREKEVELSFALSESEDVVMHILYRKLSPDSPWDSITKININQNNYIDTNVKQGTTYYYSIRAKDDSGLFSHYANAVFGKPYDNGVRPAVQNLKIAKEKANIVLNWEYKSFNKNTFFVIYKKDSKGNLKEYQRSDSLTFTDSSLKKGINSYAVKVFTKDGGESNISEAVEALVE